MTIIFLNLYKYYELGSFPNNNMPLMCKDSRARTYKQANEASIDGLNEGGSGNFLPIM